MTKAIIIAVIIVILAVVLGGWQNFQNAANGDKTHVPGPLEKATNSITQ